MLSTLSEAVQKEKERSIVSKGNSSTRYQAGKLDHQSQKVNERDISLTKHICWDIL
jgi:hypothetical protein